MMPHSGKGNRDGTNIRLSPDLQEVLHDFIKYLQAVNKSPDTIASYGEVVTQYLDHVGYVEDIYTRHSVESFLAKLRMDGVGGATLRHRFYTLKTFFTSSGHEGDWTFKKNDVPALPSIRHRPTISDDEMTKMESVAKTQFYLRKGTLLSRNGKTWSTATKTGGRWMAFRNYCIIRIADLLGPRSIELHNLNARARHSDTNLAITRTSKRSTMTTVKRW
jgi:hypothetical protein